MLSNQSYCHWVLHSITCCKDTLTCMCGGIWELMRLSWQQQPIPEQKPFQVNNSTSWRGCRGDPEVLEWWGCMTNGVKCGRKFVGHAHLIKDHAHPFILPSRTLQQQHDHRAPQTTWRVYCLDLEHCYHQPLSQCISMAKHISTTVFLSGAHTQEVK